MLENIRIDPRTQVKNKGNKKYNKVQKYPKTQARFFSPRYSVMLMADPPIRMKGHAGFSILHVLLIVHLPSHEATLLQLSTPIIWEMQRENYVLALKVP